MKWIFYLFGAAFLILNGAGAAQGEPLDTLEALIGFTCLGFGGVIEKLDKIANQLRSNGEMRRLPWRQFPADPKPASVMPDFDFSPDRVQSGRPDVRDTLNPDRPSPPADKGRYDDGAS